MENVNKNEETKMNGQLLDTLFGDGRPMLSNDAVTINLSTCRYSYDDRFDEANDEELKGVKIMYDKMLSARMNLILCENIEERSKIADTILHDTTMIMKDLGYDKVDYNNLRSDINKMESALIAINDIVTIYEFYLNLQEKLRIMKFATETEANLASMIEDDNIEAMGNIDDIDTNDIDDVPGLSPEDKIISGLITE